MINTTLSFFILMMRKEQIHTTRVNINSGSKNGTKNYNGYQFLLENNLQCKFGTRDRERGEKVFIPVV
jgi:hypothetical protein